MGEPPYSLAVWKEDLALPARGPPDSGWVTQQGRKLAIEARLAPKVNAFAERFVRTVRSGASIYVGATSTWCSGPTSPITCRRGNIEALLSPRHPAVSRSSQMLGRRPSERCHCLNCFGELGPGGDAKLAVGA